MKIFLSYSSKDRRSAEQIHLALLGSGHEVFFDKSSLPPGADFNSQIRKAIKESDAFIFLISPNSVKEGGYALTELRFAKEKWPKPWGAVLPVMLLSTDLSLIDSYLSAVTIVYPEGNVAAEVATAVEKLSRPWPGFLRPLALALALLCIIVLSIAWYSFMYQPNCSLTEEQEKKIKILKDNIQNNLKDGAAGTAKEMIESVREICPNHPDIKKWEEELRRLG